MSGIEKLIFERFISILSLKFASLVVSSLKLSLLNRPLILDHRSSTSAVIENPLNFSANPVKPNFSSKNAGKPNIKTSKPAVIPFIIPKTPPSRAPNNFLNIPPSASTKPLNAPFIKSNSVINGARKVNLANIFTALNTFPSILNAPDAILPIPENN